MKRLLYKIPGFRRMDDYTNTRTGFLVGLVGGAVLWTLVIYIFVTAVEARHTTYEQNSRESRVERREPDAAFEPSTEYYTVKTPVWETTNAVEVTPDHENNFPPCTLIRYVENGRTNEFHAWACPVVVTTNKPSGIRP